MKLFLLSLTFLFLTAIGFSQSIDSVIQIRHGYFGNRYYQNGTKLSLSELPELLKTNDEAYKQIQSARTNNLLYYVLSISGGVLLVYGILPGTFFSDPKWGLVAAGTALSVTSIILNYKSKNQAQTAIDLYNLGLRRTSFHYREIRFGIQGNGFVVSFNL